MNCLVTGANGFIGKNLVEMLVVLGHNVEPFTHRTSIRNGKWDWIFNLAGELYRKEYMFDSNVAFVNKMLEETSCINYKAYIHVGTMAEYGPINGPIVSKEKLLPVEWYGATKSCGSTMSRAFAMETRKPIVVARLFNVFGPYESPRRLIPAVISKTVRGETVSIYNGSHDFVYVEDVCDALIKIAESPVSGDEVNVGTGRMTTNREFVDILQSVTGLDIKSVNIDEFIRPYDSHFSVCDTTHAEEQYKFKARYSIELAMRRYL